MNFSRPINEIAILGAGTMGSQIAAHFANAGFNVLLLDLPGPAGKRNQPATDGLARALKLKPEPFFNEEAQRRVVVGNFEDDLPKLAAYPWILEAVAERLDIKRSLFEKVESVLAPGAIVSTNTSGIPIAQIAEGRSLSFRQRFLGTHFFNPPRYLRLLEIIPTADTQPEVIAAVSEILRVRLGKEPLLVKDTPNFIGNRIGVHSLMAGLRLLAEGGYTIPEIDALTGPLIGRASSATLRTSDVVGIDLLAQVADNLHAAVAHDESRSDFVVPTPIRAMIAKGLLGAKTGSGFYRKDKAGLASLNLTTLEYEPLPALNLPELAAIKKIPDLAERTRALYADQGRSGAFFRRLVHQLLGYSARRLPEIADEPASIDLAMQLGFGWTYGPFKLWDILGFEKVLADLRAAKIALPAWIDQLATQPNPSFYRGAGASREIFFPALGTYRGQPARADEFTFADIAAQPGRIVIAGKASTLLDMGDGVALLGFKTKANSIGKALGQELFAALEHIENSPNFIGLVVGHDSEMFSAGANLAEMYEDAKAGNFAALGERISGFQGFSARLAASPKPVVIAMHGRAFGGGCELAMRCPHVVASCESYLGLVEVGVGLIPAGGGTTRLAQWASDRAAAPKINEVMPLLQRAFETIAMAKVSTSAHQAIQMGLLGADTTVVLNLTRRFHVAKEEVRRLSRQGHQPTLPPRQIFALGRPAHATIRDVLNTMRSGNFISDYDLHISDRLAYIMTGGDLAAPAWVDLQRLLDLEKEVFLSLLGEEKTRARIESILTTNKPLRN